MIKLPTYKEIVKDIEKIDGDKNILLGNGFSMGVFDDFFNHQSLINNISDEINATNDNLIKLLSNNDVQNIEIALRVMHDSFDCLRMMNNIYINIQDVDKLIPSIESDITVLKDALIKVFDTLHPEYNSGKEDSFQSCARNLSIYNRVYTLNYDLILYWVFLKHNESQSVDKLFKDGFSGKHVNDHLLLWSPTNNLINITYLHGAIHLVQDANESICKIIKGKLKNESFIHLSDIINRLKDEPTFNNIIVLEGRTEKKLEVIHRNPYLYRGLSRLGSSSGCFVIYGCSICEDAGNINNDKHIWERIVNSKVSKIYIGICHDKPNTSSVTDALLSCYHGEDPSDLISRISFFSTDNNEIWQS